METAVYTTNKPGSPGRALFCTGAYLLIVLALAASLAANRERELVGARMEYEPWSLSFRPPRGFLPDMMLFDQVQRDVVPFVRIQPDGSTAIMAIRRMTVSSGTEPVSLCQDLVLGHTPSRDSAAPDALPHASALVGSYSGVEMIGATRSVMVRVALPTDTLALAVELVVQGTRIDDALYKKFDQFSRSIQVKNR